jgi:hypothetical protein
MANTLGAVTICGSAAASMVAYMISTTERREVRAQTVDDLRSSDWAATPVVLLDRGRWERKQDRVIDTTRAALLRALADGGDLFLFLEDDVEVNRAIRSNLAAWPPLRDHRPGGHFYASLYNPQVGSLDAARDAETYRIADPELTYGAQALVFSAATAAWILQRWDEGIGMPDIRMPRLAARRCPVLYHRPSLVQHRQVPSGWGGVPHRAVDYDRDWRAG